MGRQLRHSIAIVFTLATAFAGVACASDKPLSPNQPPAASGSSPTPPPEEGGPTNDPPEEKNPSPHSSESQGEAWQKDECVPYTGANPSFEDARLFVRQFMASSGNRNVSEFKENYLVDLTDGPGGPAADYPTFGFTYPDLKPGAVAYMTTVDCEGMFRGEGWTTWGPNTELGSVIFQAVLACDDRKGHVSNPRGSGSNYDWTKICS